MSGDLGFTYAQSTAILSNYIKADTYVCLSSSKPTKTGSNFNEPDPATGYTRKKIGPLNTSIAAQIANNDIIFIFEALADCGSLTHLGLSSSGTRGAQIFFAAELTPALTVGAGYVPLIRANKLVIGLDKEALEAYA